MNYLKYFINYLKYGKYGKKLFYLVDEIDERNFGSDAVYKPVREDLVNQDFIVYDPIPQDQYDSDFCAGYSGAYAAEATEGMQLAGAFMFALAKKVAGSINGFGTSILQICKARYNFGVCRKELYDYKPGWRDWFANWNNITPEAYKDAYSHRSKAYFQLIVPYGWDLYDAIRAYLWHFKDQKVLIQTGRDAHAATIIGYSVSRGLIGRDSYGARTYEEGLRYFNRKFANGLFTPYFSLDMERELAELLVEYNGKAVKVKDQKDCYLIQDGEKRLLSNEAVAWSVGVLLFSPDNVYEIPQTDLDKIPLGSPVSFDEGKNFPIIQRVLEKLDRLDILSEN